MIRIDPIAAAKLAYYESAVAPGVLAPRGWFCIGVYGSSGSTLFVTPDPIDENYAVPKNKGRVVEIDSVQGEGSGRFEVAKVIARVFPKHVEFVRGVIDLFDFLASEVTYGPYPTDKLIYRSDEIVEYVTPPNSSGLGTTNLLVPTKESIAGVAILHGPDLLLLSMRLPPDVEALASNIIQQVEREASSQPIR